MSDRVDSVLTADEVLAIVVEHSGGEMTVPLEAFENATINGKYLAMALVDGDVIIKLVGGDE